MKKLISGWLLLLISSVVLAYDRPILPVVCEAEDYYSGWYLGGGAGVAAVLARVDHEVNDEIQLLKLPSAFYYKKLTGRDLGDTVPAGSIFLGYGRVFQRNPKVYLGLQAFWYYAPASMKSDLETESIPFYDQEYLPFFLDYRANSIEVANRSAAGLAFKFGRLIRPKTMFYLLLGVDWSKLHYSIKHDINVTMLPVDERNGNNDSYYFSNAFHYNKEQLGWMPGVGLETMLNDRWSLALQYTYTFYGTRGKGNMLREYIGIEENFYVITTKNRVKLARNLFLLNLTYRFNRM